MKHPHILIALALTVTASGAWANPEAAMNKAGCMACHNKDKKLVGPSFKDIAAKYKGDKAAPAKLAEKVRKGGAGVWGPIPMPPHNPDKINDEDLKTSVDAILKS